MQNYVALNNSTKKHFEKTNNIWYLMSIWHTLDTHQISWILKRIIVSNLNKRKLGGYDVEVFLTILHIYKLYCIKLSDRWESTSKVHCYSWHSQPLPQSHGHAWLWISTAKCAIVWSPLKYSWENLSFKLSGKEGISPALLEHINSIFKAATLEAL